MIKCGQLIDNIIPQKQHDIVHNLDSGRSVILVLLDTSAAFDTINIENFLRTLVS